MAATQTLQFTLDGIEGEARIRRALSRLAAARAAHAASPGTAEQRRCLELASLHATAAERLSASAVALRDGAD